MTYHTLAATTAVQPYNNSRGTIVHNHPNFLVLTYAVSQNSKDHFVSYGMMESLELITDGTL